jgi:Holliday junction resolvase
MVRLANKIDDNQTAIVSALRKAGVLVLSLAAVGKGCPDLLISRGGKLALVEIKDGSKVPSKQRLTPDQERFHAVWPVYIVRSVDEALAIVRYV